MSIRHLDKLLSPTSIAVIGASDRSGSVGATVWRNLRGGAFAGPVHAVNPRLARLDGEPVFPNVAALPQAPDLALICTPPATVPGLIAELAQRGTRAAIVMSAGLDAAQKQAMLDAARPYLLRILGPNCIGLLAPHAGLNASFAHTDALPGEVAFVSQSGALVTAVLDWARSRRIGLSTMVSLGEHADVDFGDLLDYLASDVRTRAILLYAESIGEARKFMSAARAAARNKPVIIVKAGRAGAGVAAAASHTGALAGADAVIDAAIRRAGLLRVQTLAELFIAAETLARFGGNRDAALTVMTNGGGAGVMAADAAALAGVKLAPLSPEVRSLLDQTLPANWSRQNPVDLIGDAPVERYTAALQALLGDPQAGAVLFMHAPTAIVRSADIARACAPIARRAPGRVMACWLGDAAVAEARRIFEDAGIANYPTPEDAVHAFGMLDTYRRNQALLTEAPPLGADGPAADLAAVRRIIDHALADGRELLAEDEAKAVLAACGIPVVPTQALGPDPETLEGAAADIGYPVVLKIRSRDISHKSDVGGVALDIADAVALRSAAHAMLERARAARPDARIDGFTLQPMLRRPHAHELIVGTSIDPVFGPVLLFGAGGTAVEVLADRAIALPPLNRPLARELIGRTRIARLLAGYRDRPPVAMDPLADVPIALARLLADVPEIAELDINPLLADEQGVIALDARIVLARHRPGGRAHFAILPYPAELIEEVDWHGRRLRLRPVRPEDETRQREFFAAQPPEDLRLRFFSSRRELPRTELARLVQIDYAREMAFVAEAADGDDAGALLGVVHAVCDPDNVEAEFALIVRSGLHQRGLGRLLLGKMTRYLSGHGTQRLVAHVLRENTAMRGLAQSIGMKPAAGSAAQGGDALRYVAELPLPPAT
ncbi:bifunctional acetate--CoA ligase family protein/GNAT family N-acetyltransferase [Aquincola sp. S2]|uniref:Bifunctional acetate--CoA ligase family protein/GNAT family N-acetyltransferase n=1 Tax=Pseudaquabacterium terrae TaxID=2732868 RepID=A0ABX2EQU9_9BURK|nr:bifunctional acetate--CoA ligase family protein/GNAT family N-acetyltransferase [Aquabacterium terrae]NRF70978.1 bifunctional acetate--CoA ligase family protein/GNAT family N-acetyltransferase [Aquabacterium terrae]